MQMSTIRDAEAQHLLQHDPEDGYEMHSMNGEPSKSEEHSLPGSPSGKHSGSGEDAATQEEGLLMGIQEVGTFSTDPVYEAKARVLNAAVRQIVSTNAEARLTLLRSRRLVWDGINGSCLLLSDLAGPMIISGRLSRP